DAHRRAGVVGTLHLRRGEGSQERSRGRRKRRCGEGRGLIMDKTKIWILASAIVMVGILALGWFVGVDPQLKAKASTDEQRVSVEAQNTATELAIVKLKKDFESIDELKTELAGLRSSIPAAGELPDFLTQLDNLAAGSKTKVISLTVSE